MGFGKVAVPIVRKGNAVVTFPIGRETGDRRDSAAPSPSRTLFFACGPIRMEFTRCGGHFAIRHSSFAFQVGLEQKAKEFVEKGAEVYAKA